MPKRAACTIVSPNYLPYARTLAQSYTALHPEQSFFVCIVADLEDATPFRGLGFEPVMLPEIGLADLRGEAMKYEILELNTNVKPTFLRFLLDAHGLDTLVYLDPDIFVYARLDPVFAALDAGACLALTPHMTSPVWDGKVPGEQEMLFNGTYNLGFAAVTASPASRAVLAWWEARCLGAGFSEGRTGLFVDQKWMNLAPGLFEDVAILRDPGLNMAFWNLHERSLAHGAVLSPYADPVPLRFFHFSGIDVRDPAMLSRNTDRFTLADRPDLAEIFAAYKAAVIANSGHPAESLPYGFDRLSDGTALNRLARRIYAARQAMFAGGDPFDSKGRFALFAKEKGLVKGQVAVKKQTWGDFNPRDRRVEAIHRMLKLALRVLGPTKYELLMRYLSYITVLRNQAVFLAPQEDQDS